MALRLRFCSAHWVSLNPKLRIVRPSAAVVRTVDLMATGAPKERAMTRVRSGQTAYKAVERAVLRVANNNKGGTPEQGQQVSLYTRIKTPTSCFTMQVTLEMVPFPWLRVTSEPRKGGLV